MNNVDETKMCQKSESESQKLRKRSFNGNTWEFLDIHFLKMFFNVIREKCDKLITKNVNI